MTNSLPPALFLMGPTAGGKTAAAVAMARELPVDIISVDSAQVYRGMDIGTAKPDAGTLAEAPHHLIDIVDPPESFSVGDFRQRAVELMARITSAGRVPLLVGGTMLYFKALQEGLSELPRADPAIRCAIDSVARDVGWPTMHEELRRRDPETAKRVDPHDAHRIQRALEVLHATDRPLSVLVRERRPEALPYRVIAVSLEPSHRTALHARIAERFDKMLGQGLVEEVHDLRSRYHLDAGTPSMRCVGYRQAWEHLDGKLSRDELRNQGIAATRQLAKRQLTWLRSMRTVARMDCLAADAAAQVLQHFRRALEARHNSAMHQ